MSTPWNQPPTNQNNPERKNAPLTGGPLGGYENQGGPGGQQGQNGQPYQSPQQPLRPPSPFAGGLSQHFNGGLGQSPPPNSSGMPGAVPPGYSSQSPQGQGMFSNTLNMVRRWSGKMATVAGYAPQPPAPYMERYRSPQQLGVQQFFQNPSSRPWKRSRTLRVTMQRRQRRARWQQAQPNSQKIWLGALMALVAILVITSAAGISYGYFYYQSQIPRVQALAQNTVAQTSHIYDRNGLLLGSVQTRNPSTPVTYKDVPEVMQNAMIAAEDPTFWDNSGIDPQGILRALIQYISAGGKVQSGGSTITQQVIKNLSGQNQEDANRKIQEAAGAIGLTSQYPKAEILRMYFNVAAFSNRTVGIEAAVEEYFHLLPTKQDFSNGQFKSALGITQLNIDPKTGKPDPLLGLARASMLAAIPQNPTAYDPTLGDAYKQRMLARQDYVLNSMMMNKIEAPGLGQVTPDIIKQAEDLTIKMPFKAQTQKATAPHFVDWVAGQLALSLGNGNYSAGATILANGGFNIRTTLDSSLEEYAEASIKRHLTQEDLQYFPYQYYATLNAKFNINDSAAVVINVHTGEVLAMVGSADYYSTDIRVGGQANAAAGGPGTQEGSSFKPFVYATAFQMGWNPGIVLYDNKTYVPNGNGPGVSVTADYHPTNFDPPDGTGKPLTIRFATDVSFNIEAVKTGAYVGEGPLLTNLKRMGLSHVDGFVASTPLGTSNATVLEMTGAYQTFANAGTHIPPQPILDIWDNYGRSLYHYDTAKPPTVPVFSPQVAYLMTSVLIDEPTRSHEFLNDPDLSFMHQFPDCQSNAECSHQVAVKTGTTDKVVNGKDYVADNWTVGYTPDIAVGVWSGNANGDVLAPGTLGVTGAAPMWEDIISAASGYCSLKPDPLGLLPCPNVTPQSLGIQIPQIVFTKPTGVHKVSLNTYNGLAGAGNTEYVIDGLEPSSTGPALAMPLPPNNDDNKNANNRQDQGN